jgi:hypothetical protein
VKPNESMSGSKLIFEVQLISTLNHAVSTHVNAFRGVMWEAAAATNASKTEDKYRITLDWCQRSLRVLENPDGEQILRQVEGKEPGTVFLEFHYLTDKLAEFRCATHFNVKNLLLFNSIKIKAYNNNTFTGNPQMAKHEVPVSYEVNINLINATGIDVTKITHLTDIKEKDMQKSIQASAWVYDRLNSFMTHETCFQNIRTFLRIPFVSPFFSHLPRIWAFPGSRYPATVPVYLLFNALLMNDCSRTDILHTLPSLHNITTERLLRIVRDYMMGSTMCHFEGVYNSDTLFGKPPVLRES